MSKKLRESEKVSKVTACSYGVHNFKASGEGNLKFHLCKSCLGSYVCTCGNLCIYSEEVQKRMRENQKRSLTAMAKYCNDEPLTEEEKKWVDVILAFERGEA